MKTYLIYKHTNKINGKCYIGQTCYKNPEHRWHSDGSGYKTQQKFYRAIKKYTWDNFEHEILARNLSKQEADILEIKFIEQFNSINNGYNLLIGGSGQTTQGKAVYQLSQTLEILAEFSSIREASRLLYPETFNAARWSIGKCCARQLCQYKGFSWCFVKDYPNFRPKVCDGKTAGKSVYQLNKAKELLNQFNSYHDAASAVGTSAANIKRSCDTFGTAYGYYWCRYEDLEKLQQVNELDSIKDKGLLVYQLDDAKNILNIFSSGHSAFKAMRPEAASHTNDILECCRGTRLTAYGYYWCFAKDYDKFNPEVLKDLHTLTRPVQQLEQKSFNIIAEYKSANEAATAIGKPHGAQSIRECCRGNTKTAFGYVWKYKEIVW